MVTGVDGLITWVAPAEQRGDSLHVVADVGVVVRTEHEPGARTHQIADIADVAEVDGGEFRQNRIIGGIPHCATPV